MWNSLPNSLWIWPIQWRRPISKRACVSGKSWQSWNLWLSCVHIRMIWHVPFQCWSQQVSNSHPIATENRPNCDNDAGRRQARRDLQRRWWLQRTDRKVARSRRDSITPRKSSSMAIFSKFQTLTTANLRCSPRNLWIWASNHRKVCFCSVRRAQVKRCVPELLPIGPTHALFVSSALNWCKNMWAKVLVWCANYLKWPDRKKRV